MTTVLGNARAGGEGGGVSIHSKYTQLSGQLYMTGIQALVRLALDLQRADRRQGLRTAALFCGYPGSPLAGLDLELQREQGLLREQNLFHIPGVNEELALTSVTGTQMVGALEGRRYDGVTGIWYGKAPGLDRAADALKHVNMIGTDPRGGVLLLVGDDPASKSSSFPSDSVAALYAAGVPTLYPGSIAEILDLGMHGLHLSRTSGLAVALKIVTDLADASGTVEVDPDRFQPVIPVLQRGGQTFAHKPFYGFLPAGGAALEGSLNGERLELARLYARANRLNRVTADPPDAWLGIAAAGKTYADLRQALHDLGLDEAALHRYGVRLLQIGMVYPLEPEVIRGFGRGLTEILVIEEKRPFLELMIKEILYCQTDRPAVVGKWDEEGQPLVPAGGQLDADQIAVVVARRLGRRVTVESAEVRVRYLERRRRSQEKPLSVSRTPYFCSGCPHNRSTQVPEGGLVAGGIGCHGMAGFIRPGTAVVTPMGHEGAHWIGMAPFTERSHMFQNMGDGTMFHSGLMAIRAAVAANVNMTYRILYNSVVGMTGGQQPVGALAVPALIQGLTASRVRRIIVTTDDLSRWRSQTPGGIAEVWHRDRIAEAERQLAKTPGVTVLIHDQHCATDLRRKRKRGLTVGRAARVWINERVCEGCADCARKSNCLSVQPVETEFGRKTRIHQSSCNLDHSCLLGDCPALVTVKPGRQGAAAAVSHPAPPEAPLPVPDLKVPADRFTLRMLGVGGTGVVTLNQIVATAAMLDGRHVQGIDQTGMSQKAGPVVSDLRVLAAAPDGVSRLSVGQADLYLGLDLLVAAESLHLTRADPERTLAVVSTSQVPTGQMVTSPAAVTYPDPGRLRERIDRNTRADQNLYLDAGAMAEALIGDSMAANVIMLGAAYQAGGLPLSAAAIEDAIRLNGVLVEMNLAAFRWGRLAVANPMEAEAAVARASEAMAAQYGAGAMRAGAGRSGDRGQEAARRMIDATGAAGELRRLLEVRVSELTRYQNQAYAREYLAFVAGVAGAEGAALPGRTAVAEAVARNLFKLMAYKDEYEVARLHLEAGTRATLAAGFGPDARIYWHLSPPLLRRILRGRKLALGPWFRPALRLLGALRGLRGTRFDPFGASPHRRMERRLIGEYREMIEAALKGLTAANHTAVVALAELPDQIRGFDEIKVQSVGLFHTDAARLLERIGQTGWAEAVSGGSGAVHDL